MHAYFGCCIQIKIWKLMFRFEFGNRPEIIKGKRIVVAVRPNL
jgi:hypothetical protein